MRKPTRGATALIALCATLGVMPAAHASAPAPVTATPQVSPPLPDIVEQTAHAITAHHGALSVEDRAYGATFDVGGFALTPRRTARNADVVAGFVPLERAPALRISTVGATSVWHASGDVASRALAPGFTERVTARSGALEWDVVVDAPQIGGIKVIARTEAQGTPARTAHDIRWTAPDAKTVVMGELIVRDATGRELYRTVPTLIPGGVVLEVPATALTTAVYPVTLDPTVGPEFYTSDPSYGAPLGDQKKPAIASNGTISLVVWTDMRSGDQDIYGTRVDRTGAVLDTGSIPIATSKGAQGNPSVAWDGTEFLVAWDWADPTATGIGTDIWAARVGVDGTVMDPNGIRVTNQVVGNQTAPKVASDGTSSFIVWQDTRNGNADIFGARVTVGGLVQDAAGMLIAGGAASQVEPTVCRGSGGYFVAWAEGTYMKDSLVDPATGTITAGPGVSLTSTGKYNPSVAFNGQFYLVAWNDRYTSDNIKVARVSATLVVQGPEVVVSAAGNPNLLPAVAFDGTNFIVTFQLGYGSGNNYSDLKASFVRPSDGVVILSAIIVSNSANNQSSGAVAFDGLSSFVVWEDNLSGVYDIFGGRITTTGDKQDASGFLVSKSANEQTQLDMAWDGQEFFVVWADRRGGSTAYDVYGARVSANGTLLDPAGIQISTAAGDQTLPKVAWNGTTLLVSWIDTRAGVVDPRVYETPVTTQGQVLNTTGIKIEVNQYDAISHDLASDGANFLEVFQGDPGSNDLIWGAVVAPTGVAGTLVSYTTSANDNSRPAVVWGASNYLVTWTAFGTQINGNRISSGGATLDGIGFVICNATNAQGASSVASDGVDWLVTWQDLRSGRDYDVYGGRVRADASLVDTTNGFPIATDPGDQTTPSVAYDGVAYVVAWQSQRSDVSWDIIAARLRGPAVDGSQIAVGTQSSDETTPNILKGPLGRMAVSYQRFTPASSYGSTRGVIRFVDQPPNDAFADAQLLSSGAGNVFGVSAPGSKEQFEPNHAGNAGGQSVWYKWVAPAGGTVTFDTTGSTFDTLLAAYTGTLLSNLQTKASNDDASVQTTSSHIVFVVVRNQTFFLAVDGKNGAGGSLQLAWNLTADTTPPQTSITSGPPPRSNQNPVFSFTSDDPDARFQCFIDAGAFVDCTSPRTYIGLAEGSHTFKVQAIDPDNNIDPTPDERTWVIDRTPPETRITGGPASESSATSATFTFDSPSDPPPNPPSFECAFDGAAYAPCSSPRTYTNLPIGDHALYVRATDVAQNVDPSPSLYQWTVDPPDTRIIDGPTSTVASPNALFHFDSPNHPDATFECALDSGPFGGCSSPKSYAGLLAGSHEFRVRATVVPGNLDASPALYQWRVDPPDTRIVSGPPSAAVSPGATFLFDSPNETDVTLECALDAGTFGACSSPKSYAGLSAGNHEFRVRAKDDAGNVDASPALYQWAVASPDTRIIDGPASTAVSPNATFHFDSPNEAAVTFECALDAGTFGGCSSPKSYAGLLAGNHEFHVRALDDAGNVDPSPALYQWAVDPPDTRIIRVPTSTTVSPNATFDFDSPSDSAVAFGCSLDSGAFADCSSSKSYDNLTAGTHQFRVRARDVAGNVDPSPALYQWAVAPPETRIIDGPASIAVSPKATFRFDSPDASGVAFECARDSEAFGECSSPRSYVDFTAGTHQFRVRALDNAGNVDASPSLYQWTVDPPNTRIIDGPPSITTSSSATFHFDSPNEADVTFQCKLDLGEYEACSSPSSPQPPGGLNAGPHRYWVRAVDSRGNEDPTPDSYGWTIDTTGPGVKIESPTPGVWAFGSSVAMGGTRIIVIGDVQVVASAPDPAGISSMVFKVDNVRVPDELVTYDQQSRRWSFHFVPAPSADTPLTHTIIATAIDGVGNSASDSKLIYGLPAV